MWNAQTSKGSSYSRTRLPQESTNGGRHKGLLSYITTSESFPWSLQSQKPDSSSDYIPSTTCTSKEEKGKISSTNSCVKDETSKAKPLITKDEKSRGVIGVEGKNVPSSSHGDQPRVKEETKSINYTRASMETEKVNSIHCHCRILWQILCMHVRKIETYASICKFCLHCKRLVSCQPIFDVCYGCLFFFLRKPQTMLRQRSQWS